MKMLLFVAIFCSIVVFNEGRPNIVTEDDTTNCGYKSCHPVKEGFINVHIVPHTHDDVGWLKTVDQYFYGSKPKIQKAVVQNILNSVVDALSKNEERRFIYVETAFFWKWWIHLDDSVKSKVRNFVNNGQLEFIGGAWSMNDEAVTHYQSIIDQFTWGLRKLNETFGECGRPKIGWQIDPFGHSREMASIFAQMGFDGLLLGRIDTQEKAFRLRTKSAEMVWRGSQNLGSKSEIFTGVMSNTYSPPPGFCFDIHCTDEPIVDDRRSPDYNVDQRIYEFIFYLDLMAKYYATSNIIVTMGEDFHYEEAENWYKNLDKLIHHTNLKQENGSIYNLLYSTPSCYIKAIHDETEGKTKWLVKEDDFFPYSSDPHSFWTGFYTSRPTIKRYEREANNFLQVSKQLYALTDLGPEDGVDLDTPREAMGVLQHHDAITGTEKQLVAFDYARILSEAMDKCEFIAATALSKIISPQENQHSAEEPAPAIPLTTCRLLNISQCEFSENNDNFVVTVYNPLSRSATKFVRLPVEGTAYSVFDSDGELVTQLIPIPSRILTAPGRTSKATAELIFQAKNIPPLGFESYYVEKVDGDTVLQPGESVSFQLQSMGIDIDPTTKLISAIHMNNNSLDFSQEFLYYDGFVGNNKIYVNRSSGAYIFRPVSETGHEMTEAPTVQSYEGPLVAEYHQQFNEWISQVIRIYLDENYVEFDWFIGPIPQDIHGKEIISRYKTPLDSSSSFYTDSNGREVLKRVRSSRPTWNLTLIEPVAGNYYPVTSKILLKDDDIEVAVLTDRAQGGSSLKDGEMELMLHRNCLSDDGFGVDEALNEHAFLTGLTVRGSHYVVFGSTDASNPGKKTLAAQERNLAQEKLLSPYIFLSPTNGLSYEQYKDLYQMTFAGLVRALPENVQILTLEPWIGSSFLLRLEHILENDEDPTLAQPVTIDLNNLFSSFEVTSIQETTLGANQWLADNDRLQFETGNSIEDLVHGSEYHDNPSSRQSKYNHRIRIVTELEVLNETGDFQINLEPMQIRTFVIETMKYV